MKLTALSFLHPDEMRLTDVADDRFRGVIDPRVAAHLAGCTRCRQTVQQLRRLRAAVEGVHGPRASAEQFERAMRRRIAGERVILPVDEVAQMDSRPTGRPRITAVARIAAMALLVLGSVIGLAQGTAYVARQVRASGHGTLGAPSPTGGMGVPRLQVTTHASIGDWPGRVTPSALTARSAQSSPPGLVNQAAVVRDSAAATADPPELSVWPNEARVMIPLSHRGSWDWDIQADEDGQVEYAIDVMVAGQANKWWTFGFFHWKVMPHEPSRGDLLALLRDGEKTMATYFDAADQWLPALPNSGANAALMLAKQRQQLLHQTPLPGRPSAARWLTLHGPNNAWTVSVEPVGDSVLVSLRGDAIIPMVFSAKPAEATVTIRTPYQAETAVKVKVRYLAR